MKKLFIMILAIIFIGVGVGGAFCEESKDNAIPNFTQEDPNDTNGRPAHLDIEKEPDQLNPVERTIILKNAILLVPPVKSN